MWLMGHIVETPVIIYQRLEEVMDMISFKSQKHLMPGEQI